MNRPEALDRYGFSANVVHNPAKREGMPSSYGECVLTNFIERAKKKTTTPIVLDLACGIGKVSDELENNSVKTVRLDVSFKSLKRNLGSKVQAIFTDIPFKAQSFDAIHFKDALVHVPNHVDLFGQLYRILKPGGELMIATSEHHTLFPSFKIRYKKSGNLRTINFFDEEEYIQKIQKMKAAGRMSNKEVYPPYYPTQKSILMTELRMAGLLINTVSTWKPEMDERDWYTTPTKRIVVSSVRPSST